MALLPKRGLASEAALQFKRTPGERAQVARQLRRVTMALFLANHPGVSESVVRRILSRKTEPGRLR